MTVCIGLAGAIGLGIIMKKRAHRSGAKPSKAAQMYVHSRPPADAPQQKGASSDAFDTFWSSSKDGGPPEASPRAAHKVEDLKESVGFSPRPML